MSFFTMADNNIDILAKRDGALYNVSVGNTSFVIKGIGNEMVPSITNLTVSVQSGEAVIHGRHVTSEMVNTLELPPNESGYVVLRIDLSQPTGAEAFLYATPVIVQNEINWTGTIHDLPIATFTSTGTSAQIVDVRKVIDSVGASTNRFSDIPVVKTPVALGGWMAWDTQHLYPYYFDVDINGLTENSLIENIIMTDTLLATVGYIATTMSNKLRFYTQTNDSVSGTIITLITSEV